MGKGINSLRGVKPSDVYQKDDGTIWYVESVCDAPTATLRRIRGPKMMHEDDGVDVVSGAIGCLNLQPFTKLVPEAKDS